MKRILTAVLLSTALVVPAFSHAPGDGHDGHHHDGPKPQIARQAPAQPVPAPAASSPAAASPAPASASTEVTQLTAHVIVEKDKDGKAVAKAKTDDGTLIPLEGDKVAELLKLDNLPEKQFVLSGEKRPAAAGACDRFLVREFFELEHDHSAHGHEGHSHGQESFGDCGAAHPEHKH